MADRPIRIVICEDSRAHAAALARYLERDPELSVVAVFSRCDELIRGLPAAQADLAIIDVDLPGRDGVYATRCIMGWRPIPIVILGERARTGSERTAAALAAGALDAIDRRAIDLHGSSHAPAVALRRRIKRLARTRLGAATSLPSPPLPAPGRRVARLATVVAVAASTGGPAALMEVLAALPGDFPVPVLVVQHISAGFAPGLAIWLNGVARLPVALAVDGERIAPGVTVAPDGAHLRLGPGGRLSLDKTGPGGGHRPSGDVLLTSVAESARSGAVSVVLTGMGRDGAEGTAAIRAAGGLTIAQDQASSIIFGMPRAAAERGAEMILPLAEIGGVLGALLTARSAA